MLQKTKSLLTKCLAFLFIVCCVVAATVGMVACSDDQVAAKTIKSIANDGKNIVITYSDGTKDTVGYTDTTPSDPVTPVEPTACEHKNTKNILLAVEDGCNHRYLVTCSDCGSIVDVKSVVEHTWSEEPADFKRESCKVGAHTAIYCTVCKENGEVVKKEDTIKYKSDDEDGKCYEHDKDKVVHGKYLIDEDGKLGDNVCVCDLIEADICTVCNTVVGKETVINKAKGHVWSDWSIDKAPAKEKGSVSRYCTVCVESTEDKEIPALFVADKEDKNVLVLNSSVYTLVKKGERSDCTKETRVDKYSCVVDGQTLTFEDKVDAETSHYIMDGNKKVNVDISAAETNYYVAGKFELLNGVKTVDCKKNYGAMFVCEECGYRATVNVTAKHAAYNEATDKASYNVIKGKEATCTREGAFNYTCYTCKGSAEGVIPAFGHSYTLSEGAKSIVQGKDGKYTITVKCEKGDAITDDGKITLTFVAKSLTVKNEAATCTDGARTVYTDIVLPSGEILKNADGTVASVYDSKGSALGHKDNVVVGGKYEYSSLTETNVILTDSLNARIADFKNPNACARWDEASDGFSAVYHCPDCNSYITISVYKNHVKKADTTATWIWTDELETEETERTECSGATCTRAATLVMTCVNCCTAADSTVNVSYSVEGHDIVYVLDADNKKIASAKCTVCSETFTNDDTAAVVLIDEDVSDIVKPNCQRTGSAVVKKGQDGEETVTLAKNDYHVFGGKPMNGTAEKPVAYQIGMLDLNGKKVTCLASDDVNVGFYCDDCGVLSTTFAIGDHAYTKNVVAIASGCTTPGERKWICSVCSNGVEQSTTIPALGHEYAWEKDTARSSNTEIVLKLTCTRCGEDEDSNNGVITVIYDLSTVFSSEEGKIVVDSTMVAALGFTYEVKAGGTCETYGRYRFTLTDLTFTNRDEDVKSTYATDVAFDIVIKADHAYDDNPITWNGHSGHRCDVCGKID